MKPIWLWLAFLLLYGLFSMKTQAAGLAIAKQSKSVSGSQRWVV